MNFEGLKTDFINYLKDLNTNKGKHYVVDKGDVSIFMYANEFKDYLEQSNLDCSDVSIFTKSVNEILSMDIQNGKLVDAGSNKDKSQDFESDTKIQDENFMKNFLVDLVNDSDFQNLIDIDESGEVDNSELKSFFNAIKSNDGNNNTISLDDIIQAVSEIEDGTFSLNGKGDTNEKTEENKVNNTTTTPRSTGGGTSASSGFGGTSSASGGNGISSGLSSPTANSDEKNNIAQTNDISNMSLDELEQEKSNRENNVADARENINAVYSGENANVSKANNDYEKAKQDYEKALKEDKNVSEKLKKQHEKDIKAVEDKQKEIDETNIKINDKESEIASKENEISDDEANIAALESALASLSVGSNADDEAKAQIEAQRAELQAQLDEAKAQKEAHEEEKTQLENELEELKTTLSDKESELEELEAAKQKTEDEILKNCGEATKEALQVFNTAKDKVGEVKEKELSSAKQVLTEATNKLNEINNVINDKKTEETQKTNDGKSALAQTALEAALSQVGYGYWWGEQVPDGGFDCNGLTNWAWAQAGVDIPYRSGTYSYGQFQWMHENGNWVNNVEDLNPGDLVFFSKDGGNTCYHVAMYAGNGQVVHAISTTYGIQLTDINFCSGFCGGGSPI